MRSVTIRLVKGFMSVILISVIMFIGVLSIFIKQYYYNNVEDIIINQVKASEDFYIRYFSDVSLYDNILDNVDVFWKQTTAQVQIIDPSGHVLMDSIGVTSPNKVDTIDFKRAMQGQTGKWQGMVDYDDAKVMSVAHPIMVNGEIIGVLRFIASLKEVDREIRSIIFIFSMIGLATLIISGIVSVFFARGLVGPIKEVTRVAEKMAAGNFEVKCEKKFDDEIGKLSDTLNYMADEIIKKDNLKNEFIASVSHELRTPLTSIQGWSIILNTDHLEDKQLLSDGLKIIEKESQRLSLMVEDLLDFSKLIYGKLVINKRKVDIVELIRYIEKHMTPLAERNKLQFAVKYDKNMPMVVLDENRVKQVLINVLDNAFKFTPQGSMVIFETKIQDGYLNMVVIDNGCGISDEDLPKVKEKFYKGKNSKAHTGIGLSICQEIVNRHNGEFNITSQLGRGTQVIIKLPVD